jgi:hypothetical protein
MESSIKISILKTATMDVIMITGRNATKNNHRKRAICHDK